MSPSIKAAAISLAVMSISTAPVQAAEKEVVAPIEIPAPPAGKGQIVFFRPSAMGMAMGCAVNENGQKISSLGNSKYFILVTEPGKHQYSVKSEAKDTLTLEVEPDETQYAQCRIKMGILMGRPDLRPATKGEFEEHSKLKMVDADDMGPGPGALRPDEVKAALAAPTAAN